MPKRRIEATGIEISMFIIATVALYSTWHWVGGSVCLFFCYYIASHESGRQDKSLIDHASLKEAVDDYVQERDAEEAMSPFERDAALAAFRAGAEWLEAK